MILVQNAPKVVYFAVSAVVASVVLGKGNGGGFNFNGTYDLNGSTNNSQLVCRVDLSGTDTNTIGPLDVLAIDGSGNCVGAWHGVVLADYPSVGDPMAASVPGAYSPGQAGFLIGSALAALSGVLPATANAAIGVEVLDKANGIETGLTVRQALRLIAASLTGKLAIVGSTVTIKGAGVNTDRVAATTDAIGQRTAVTLTP